MNNDTASVIANVVLQISEIYNIAETTVINIVGLSCDNWLDILPRLKRVGFLCASAGRRIRYGLTPAPQFGDAPPKYILSRIEVAVVYFAALLTNAYMLILFVHISASAVYTRLTGKPKM